MQTLSAVTLCALGALVLPSGPALAVAAPVNPASVATQTRVADLQAEDGSWPAALPGLAEPARNAVARGEPGDDLATSAVALWTLIGDGHALELGTEKAAVRSTFEWLEKRLAEGERSPSLMPGEGLASLALVDLAAVDAGREATAAALRAQARLVGTQAENGSWPVLGRDPGDPQSVEETGWAALALAIAAGDQAPRGVHLALERAREALRQFDGDVAASFTLLLDARKLEGDSRAELPLRFARIHGRPETPTGSALRDLLASATAWTIGGETWKGWERGALRTLVADQLSDGPARGFWPSAGDPRGALWERALRAMTLQIYFRYQRNGLAR